MLDSSIAMGYQPVKIENPMNQLAQLMQIRTAQSQYDVGQQGLQETNKLNTLYSDALGTDGKIDRNKLFAGAARQGLGSKIPGLQKTFLETDEAQGKVDKQKIDLVDAKLKQSRQFLDGVQTPEQYLSWHQANHDDPVIGPLLASRGVTVDTARSQINEALQQPGGFDSLLKKSALGLEKFTELNKPSYQTQNTGDRTTILAMPGLGGAPATVSSAAINQSPDNRASVGASMANAAATRSVAQATRDAAGIQRDRDTEMKLGDDYRAQSKDFRDSTAAYRQINATLDQATKSPAATLAAATKFMKLLDPGSVVRESELGMALAASGVIDRAQNYVNTLQNGKVLTPSQVVDFRNITGKMYEAAQQVQRQVDADYTGKANRYNLRPENVVQGLGQNDTNTGGMPSDIQALVRKHTGGAR